MNNYTKLTISGTYTEFLESAINVYLETRFSQPLRLMFSCMNHEEQALFILDIHKALKKLEAPLDAAITLFGILETQQFRTSEYDPFEGLDDKVWRSYQQYRTKY